MIAADRMPGPTIHRSPTEPATLNAQQTAPPNRKPRWTPRYRPIMIASRSVIGDVRNLPSTALAPRSGPLTLEPRLDPEAPVTAPIHDLSWCPTRPARALSRWKPVHDGRHAARAAGQS